LFWGVVKRMKGSPKKNNSFLTLLLLALVASSCVLPAPRPAGQSGTPFRPPTLAPTITPTAGDPNLVGEGTSNPIDCNDGLTFVSDVTIPDGTEVAPKSRVDKRWEVENSGTCSWTGKYHLKLVGGEALGAKDVQSLLPLKAGAKGDIRVMFTAPSEPGAYSSAWQAYNADDVAFGDPIYLQVTVTEKPQAATVAPAPTQQ
jgi:hypothetical protein